MKESRSAASLRRAFWQVSMVKAVPETTPNCERPSAPLMQSASPLFACLHEFQTAVGSSTLKWQFHRLAMSVEEAAAATGLSRSFLYGEIGAGRLKAIKPGAATRILVWELVAYLLTRPEFEVAK